VGDKATKSVDRRSRFHGEHNGEKSRICGNTKRKPAEKTQKGENAHRYKEETSSGKKRGGEAPGIPEWPRKMESGEGKNRTKELNDPKGRYQKTKVFFFKGEASPRRKRNTAGGNQKLCWESFGGTGSFDPWKKEYSPVWKVPILKGVSEEGVPGKEVQREKSGVWGEKAI